MKAAAPRAAAAEAQAARETTYASPPAERSAVGFAGLCSLSPIAAAVRLGTAAFEEQEADRVADRVVASRLSGAAPGGEDSGHAAPAILPLGGPRELPGVGPGRAISSSERQWSESRLGWSFADVRVHPNRASRRAAAPLGWTYGRHIGLPPNALSTPLGRHVFAHELAHVVQQAGRSPSFQEYGAASIDPLYWFELAIASMLPPYFPISTTAVYQQAHPMWGYLAIWGQAFAGDFVDDPTFAAIIVRTLLTLIPYVDTAADVEDMAAAFYQLIYLQRYNEVMPWVSFVLSLIGFFPELGSIFEGIARGILLKGGGYAISGIVGGAEFLAKHIDELDPHVRKLGREVFDGVWAEANRIRSAIAAFDPGAAGRWLLPDWGEHVDEILTKLDNDIIAPLRAARAQLEVRVDEAMEKLRAAVSPQAATVPPVVPRKSGRAAADQPLLEADTTPSVAAPESPLGTSAPHTEARGVHMEAPPPAAAVAPREINENNRALQDLLGESEARDLVEHPGGTALVLHKGNGTPSAPTTVEGSVKAQASATPKVDPAPPVDAPSIALAPAPAAAAAPSAATPSRSPSRSKKQREAERTAEAARPLDVRLAETEAALDATRRRVVAGKKAQVAAGKAPKGGAYKKLWNLYERKWVLARRLAYPNARLLEQVTVVGVRLPDGKLLPTRSIAGKGRIFDFVEIDAGDVVAGDLKSASELMKSVEGGATNADDIALKWRSTSKIGEQHAVESQVRAVAQEQGGTVVLSGFDVDTGSAVEMEIAGEQLFSIVWHYEEVFEN